jgi:dTDP-4-dehydrorhamnose reductase
MRISGKVLITGCKGQVGRALTQLLGDQAIPVDRTRVDLSRPDQLLEALNSFSTTPVAVINAAAYTQVDRAESEKELAEAINGRSPGILAQWCASHGIPLIHYSTDYVFSGEGDTPWRETDPTSPLNAYGASKLKGEELISKLGKKWLIFRTSWVYDATGHNFLRTMLRLGSEREELKVVGDQFGAPTYAPHLARATLQALEKTLSISSENFPSGVYHLCNTGVTTWHGFAEEIFRQARTRNLPSPGGLKIQRLLSIKTEDYPTPAKRPGNSRLNTDQAISKLGVRLPEWQQGLSECLDLMAKPTK